MSQEIKIQLNQRSRFLDLICGEGQFKHLRDLVADTVGVSGQIDVPDIDGVRLIVIRLESAETERSRMGRRWAFVLCLFSGAPTIVGYAVMIQWIMQWLR
jgi:hypothetical protein